jgi:riboflavin synthase
MFTGLVEALGSIETVNTTAAGTEFRVTCPWTDLAAGESVAVNGACLTVRDTGEGWFTVAAVSTTIARTAIGAWEAGTPVNLERAMKLGDRLGGHLVQGHVDAVGTVRDVRRQESALLIDIDVPPDVARYLVPYGSVTVDGVSLTVNALPSGGVLQVSIIEYTERHTTLGRARPGLVVHLEADVIGKYVDSLVRPWATPPGGA